MITRTDKQGISHQFALDLEWILAEEERDPKYSFFKDLENIAENPRLTTIKRMSEAMGYEFLELSKIFTIFEIVAIFGDCCKDMGFIPTESDATV